MILYPAFLVILLVVWNMGDTTRKIYQIEVKEKNLIEVEPLTVH
jgi:hypothetical protein